MPDEPFSRRAPLSDAHVRLGTELRRIRQSAHRTTRDMDDYSSGHISNVENGHVTPSKELIETYAKLGGDRRKLFNLYETLNRTIAERRREHREEQRHRITEPDITIDTPFDQILSSYTVEDSENIFRYDGRGVLAQLTCVLRIKSKVALLRYVACTHNYLADTRRGVLSIEAGTGCEVAKTTEGESGVIQCVLKLNKDLKPEDDSYVYSYHLLVSSEKRMEPLLRQHYRLHRSRQAWQVQFTKPATPERIWWFRSAYTSATTVDAEEGTLFPPDPRDFYFYEFFDLENELAGIAWRWKD